MLWCLTNFSFKKFPLIIYTSNYYPLKGGHTYQSFKDFNNVEKLDVLFLGSSHAYRSFDPRIFRSKGLTTFNLGTSGQDLYGSYYLLKHFILEKAPKCVVLEVCENSFIKREVLNESAFDLALNTPTDKILFSYLKETKDWRLINLFFYKLFSSYKPAVYLDTTYIGKGYSENNYKNYFPVSIVNDNNDKAVFTEDRISKLDKIIKLCKSFNVKLILVSQPLPLEQKSSLHNRFLTHLLPICKKENISYLDYSFKHKLNSRDDFFDDGHLNQSGVNYFNNTLLNDFKFITSINGK